MSSCRARICATALWVVWVAPIPAVAAATPSVRVLLSEGADPVRVAGGEGSYRISVSGPALRVDGGSPLSSWRTPSAGIWRAGSLRVRGIVEVRRTGRGLGVVNEVALEHYVAGTLAREVYPAWNPGALRAQAVAIRTYALHRSRAQRGVYYDVSADTASQVYGGVDAETPTVRAAVEATRGEILTYGGEPILAAFHSASGGRTAAAWEVWGEPVAYLVAQPVEDEDDSPDTYWRVVVSRTTLGRVLVAAGAPVGDLRDVEVTKRSESGRVLLLRVRGSGGTVALSGRELRAALGESTLKSTLFEIQAREDEIVFVGSGSGHGVGMSQWGARSMAEHGAGYREILETFYPGTRLESLSVRAADGAPERTVLPAVGAARSAADSAHGAGELGEVR